VEKSWYNYSIGEKLSKRAFDLAMRSNFDLEKQKKVIDILYAYKDDPDNMDLQIICKLEALLNEELLIIPTKQQWRKIKLQKINDLYVEEGE